MLHNASVTKTAKEANFIRAAAELELIEARNAKAELIKDRGEPIELTGKALGLEIDGKYAWIAENTAVLRKVNLETGKTAQLYKGHTAPVTCLAFYDIEKGRRILISGAWDQTIRLWDTTTRTEISVTPKAHSDFVKTLLVIPELKLLVSGSSDKIVRFWNLATLEEGKPLTSAGSISSHTRPVECLAIGPVDSHGESPSAILFTADTMGLIRAWKLTLDEDKSAPPRWHARPADGDDGGLMAHRTGVTEMWYGKGLLYTASLDESVFIQHFPALPNISTSGSDSGLGPSSESGSGPAGGYRRIPPIVHRTGVRCLLPLHLTSLGEDAPYLLTGSGDFIRTFDLGSIADAEQTQGPSEAAQLVGTVDGHWHDVTALRLWLREVPAGTVSRSTVASASRSSLGEEGKTRLEPWVVSASLDGTIRKWRLLDLLQPVPKGATSPLEASKDQSRSKETTTQDGGKKDGGKGGFELTEEEERELAELMDED